MTGAEPDGPDADGGCDGRAVKDEGDDDLHFEYGTIVVERRPDLPGDR